MLNGCFKEFPLEFWRAAFSILSALPLFIYIWENLDLLISVDVYRLLQHSTIFKCINISGHGNLM